MRTSSQTRSFEQGQSHSIIRPDDTAADHIDEFPPDTISEDAENDAGHGLVARPLQSVVGGSKRWRSGGSMHQIRRPARLIPQEMAVSRGYRFPDHPVTQTQEQSLKSLVDRYIERQFVHSYKDAGRDVLHRAMKISLSKASTLIKKVETENNPWTQLATEVLLGMHAGTITRPEKTRKTQETQWLFRKLYHDGLGRRLAKDSPDDDFLRILHAAFKVDYLDWQRDK